LSKKIQRTNLHSLHNERLARARIISVILKIKPASLSFFFF